MEAGEGNGAAMIQQEQISKVSPASQASKTLSNPVKYKCVTAWRLTNNVTKTKHPGENEDEFHIRTLVGEETEYQNKG